MYPEAAIRKPLRYKLGFDPFSRKRQAGVMRKDIEIIEEIPQISDSTYSDSKVSTRNISIFPIFPIGFFRLFQL
ncbi:MAG: hypothetical protein WBL44_13240 [Nitrososphaeraceae archaeon]|jgi:hypothetical protein